MGVQGRGFGLVIGAGRRSWRVWRFWRSFALSFGVEGLRQKWGDFLRVREPLRSCPALTVKFIATRILPTHNLLQSAGFGDGLISPDTWSTRFHKAPVTTALLAHRACKSRRSSIEKAHAPLPKKCPAATPPKPISLTQSSLTFPSHHSQTPHLKKPQMTAHNTMSAPVDRKEQEDMFRTIGDTVDAVSGGGAGADSTAEERANIEDPQVIDHIGMFLQREKNGVGR